MAAYHCHGGHPKIKMIDFSKKKTIYPIDNSDPLALLRVFLLQVFRSDSDIVEETEAHGLKFEYANFALALIKST